jgi:hypothetical protein
MADFEILIDGVIVAEESGDTDDVACAHAAKLRSNPNQKIVIRVKEAAAKPAKSEAPKPAPKEK